MFHSRHVGEAAIFKVDTVVTESRYSGWTRVYLIVKRNAVAAGQTLDDTEQALPGWPVSTTAATNI